MKVNDPLFEGGNVFKTKTGEPLTQRINQTDIMPTVQWLEKITGLDFTGQLDDNGYPVKWLGTTGKKSSSGDLDLAVNEKEISKDELFNRLVKWCATAKVTPADFVRKTGDSVHLKTPINGSATNGFVQTDFMMGDPAWQQFSMQGGREGSPYNGANKHVLLASIAKAHGLKWSYKVGLTSRTTGNVITRDPDEIARYLLGPTANRTDLSNVEAILEKIKGQPNYAELTADARETFAKGGLQLPESIQVGSGTWFRNMSNLFS